MPHSIPIGTALRVRWCTHIIVWFVNIVCYFVCVWKSTNIDKIQIDTTHTCGTTTTTTTTVSRIVVKKSNEIRRSGWKTRLIDSNIRVFVYVLECAKRIFFLIFWVESNENEIKLLPCAYIILISCVIYLWNRTHLLCCLCTTTEIEHCCTPHTNMHNLINLILRQGMPLFVRHMHLYLPLLYKQKC